MMRLIPSSMGQYAISSDGLKIYSLYSNGKKRRSPLLLHPHISKDGYARISLTFPEQGRKSFLVHRLVAETFLDGTQLEVNHRNGIRWDNRAENLEFVSHSDNVKHSYNVLGHPRCGSKHVEPVICQETGKLFLSLKSAAETVGAPAQGIYQSVKYGWKCKGFHWIKAQEIFEVI